MSDEERMSSYLPYARQWISEKEIKEVLGMKEMLIKRLKGTAPIILEMFS